MIGRIAGIAAALSLAAGLAAASAAAGPAAPGRGPGPIEARAAAGATSPLAQALAGEAAALEAALEAAAGAPARIDGVEMAKKKLGGAKRGGARVRAGTAKRYHRGGAFKSNNRVVINKTVRRGRPGYYGPRGVYIEDDDGDGVVGALIGGVIGLGVGAAIASGSTADNTCVDNDGDGVCDGY